MAHLISLEELTLLGISPSLLQKHQDAYPESDPIFFKQSFIEPFLCALYENFPTPTNLNIVLFTWVIGDGLGDFSAQLETAQALLRTLKNKYRLTLISLHPERMPLSPPSFPCKYYFIPYEENELPGQNKWNDIAPVNFPDQVITALQQANVIIQMPTYFPFTPSLLKAIFAKGAPSYELIGEGGWSRTPFFSPQAGSRSLGLHSWEIGLFFPPITAEEKPKNKALQKIIEENSILCSGYLRNPAACVCLLKLFLAQHEESSKDLTLALFPCEGLIKELPTLHPLLVTYGIRQVEIVYKNNCCKIEIQKKGKQLTVVQIPKLTREEYHTLLLQSHSLVGCRGDGSLSEVLSAQKIPFFDFPEHKKPLLEGLIRTCYSLFSADHDVIRYLEGFTTPDFEEKKMASLLRSPSLQQGFITLSNFLQSYYKADSFIHNLVMRAACHHLHPELALFEKFALDGFLFGNKKAFTALYEVKSYLATYEKL